MKNPFKLTTDLVEIRRKTECVEMEMRNFHGVFSFFPAIDAWSTEYNQKQFEQSFSSFLLFNGLFKF